MEGFYNGEKIIVGFSTKRKLNLANQGTNMVANCLLGHNKTSGPEPDLYYIFLTEKTFFAEFSRKSLHGDLPEKVTKLNIPIKDIVHIELNKKDKVDNLYIKSDWGKEYNFEIENETKKNNALVMIEYIEKVKNNK